MIITAPGGGSGGGTPVTTAGQGYFWAPFGDIMAQFGGSTIATLSANQVRAILIYIPYAITFTKVGVNMVTTSNTNHFYLAFYSADKNTLIRQITYNLTAATGAYNVTVASTTLTPAAYWFAWGADNSAAATSGISTNATMVPVLNQNNVYLGNSNQSIAAGVMPPSLGTLTGSTLIVPSAVFEP